jgi:TolB-like protein
MAQDQKTQQRRLEIGHVLFLDIVGYSKLLIDEQSEALQELNQIVRNTKAAREGQAARQLIYLPTGDGMALVFTGSVEEPVECALQISQALRAQPSIPVRMGIHSGPVDHVTDVNQRENIAGAGINIAQRVMDCGDAGHILISKRVADDLAQYRRWQPYLHELGDVEVKHGVVISIVNFYADVVGNPAPPTKISHYKRSAQRSAAPGKRAKRSPLLITLIVIGAILFTLAVLGIIFAPAILKQTRARETDLRVPTTSSDRSIASIPEKSIAVLPFENHSHDPDNAYFAEGIQDEILTRLSKIADLKVISRTSTRHYTSAPENLSEIGKQLGVAHIAEGSVQKSGDAVRVNVQLIKAANDSHIWAETFDRKLTDIFAVESEIAKTIGDQLGARLNGREVEAVVARPTDNAAAYDAYLRGLVYNSKGFTAANVRAAQKYLQQAVKLDPKFASAWALLSQADSFGYVTANLPPTTALREEAREAADIALKLDPAAGEAFIAQGVYHYACLKDYDAAVKYFEAARKALPSSGQIPEMLAYVSRRRGEWDKSEALFNEAERLNPRDINLLTQHAILYQITRRFTEAERKLDQVLEIAPGEMDARRQKASVVQSQGDLPRAGALLASLPPTNDSFVLRATAYQAILERHPNAVIPRLEAALADPDAAAVRVGGVVPFFLGWARQVAGDAAGAHETWLQNVAEMEASLKNQAGDIRLMGILAMTYAALGDKEHAIKLAETAISLMPIEKDALAGRAALEVLARVLAQTGESEGAIRILEKLLGEPFEGTFTVTLTPAILRLDPMFDPLRNDPRFQKLCEGNIANESK